MTPATLEVFDPGEREPRCRSSAGGVHPVEWHEPGMADGVYWLRLRQGTNTATARAIVIR